MDTSGAISLFKKGDQPALGDKHAAWAGRPDFHHMEIPGGETLAFDLSKLSLQDFQAMRHHPQINASLSVLTFMIHQADWKIECKDAKIREMIEENVATIWTRLVRAISQAFWAGYSPSALEYENDPQGRFVVINKVKDLSPMECNVHWRTEKVKVGDKTHTAYYFDGIDQWGWGHIPAMNSFWYPVLMENGNYSGRKLLKAAFAPWYFSQLMHLYTNRYFERFGEPLPIGRAPFEHEIVEPDGQGGLVRRSAKEIMGDVMEGIRSRGVVLLPSDRTMDGSTGKSTYEYEISYLESQMRGVDFERYLTRLDEEMSLALFTPLLLLRNADVGSHALGVQHTQTWLWELNALLGDMKEYIDRYIVNRLKEINFSPKAEKAEWVPRKLGKESAETLRAIISALISADKASVDLEELGTALGMTVKQVRQVQEPDPAQPGVDNRNRDERDRSADGRSASNEPPSGRPTTLTARIRTQAASTWDSGVVHVEGLNNFERVVLGQEADAVNGVLKALDGLPTEEFGSIEMFMNAVRRGLDRAQQPA